MTKENIYEKKIELENKVDELENKVDELERRLKIAQSVYLELLWEYTCYKDRVRRTFKRVEQAYKNFDAELSDLDMDIHLDF